MKTIELHYSSSEEFSRRFFRDTQALRELPNFNIKSIQRNRETGNMTIVATYTLTVS
jgi:hypothetical protein